MMPNSKSSKKTKKAQKQNRSDVASSAQTRFPFEPKGVKNKSPKMPSPIPTRTQPDKKQRSSLQSGGVPTTVSKRMAKRMAFFCGTPTLIGLAVLPVSYVLISRDIVALPNTAVLLVSLLCLGLSVLGLSYGVISASWDEEQPGSLLGIQEFQLNFKRLVQGWRESR